MGKKLILLIIIIIACYSSYNCIIEIEKDYFATLEDKQNNRIIKILKPGYNFIRQGLFSWDISINKYNTRYSDQFKIKIPVPALEELESNYYSIVIPINIIYRIDIDSLILDISGLKKDKNLFRDIVEKIIKENMTKELSMYFIPNYNKNALERNKDNIMTGIHAKLKERCGNIGIDIMKFEIIGPISFPEISMINDGLRYLDEMRRIEKNNKKELILLNNNLLRDEIINKKYVEKLKEISKLVKDNPNLLKYLYIDKLSKNVQVIISSDRSGMPFGMHLDSDFDKIGKRNEIDNLK
jgi:hypothetical protein